MNIGCGTVLFREYDLDRSLAAIREIGYRYFETQAVGPWCPHVNVERDDPETLVRLKNKHGFAGISGLWSLDGNIISNPRAVESGIRSVEWAAAAGIPVLHTGDGHKPEGMTDEEAYQVLADKLSPILEAARKHGVTVAIEPHGTFSLTLAGLQRIMALGEPEVLGINYDACNIFRAGYVESGSGRSGWRNAGKQEDELTVLRGIAGRVVHVHAKDLNTAGQCVAVGSGLVNVKGCLAHLKETGYRGVVSVETEGGGSFESIVTLAAASYSYLSQLLQGGTL